MSHQFPKDAPLNCRLRLLRQHVEALRAATESLPPSTAQAFVSGFVIANLVGPIDDAKWAAMIAESKLPCGRPDCGCEIERAPLFAALDQQRQYWRDQMEGNPE
jgi:hypothetical protein